MALEHARELEIVEDMPLERATWTVERVAWLLMLLALAAAFLGLCGSAGPLAKASAGDAASGLKVEYDRFARHGGVAKLDVRVGPELIKDGAVRLWVENAYVEDFAVESFTAEPDATHSGPDRAVYTFAVADASEPVTIGVQLRPGGYWLYRARLGVVDGPEVALRQFVYP
jgi:hypothetical protein